MKGFPFKRALTAEFEVYGKDRESFINRISGAGVTIIKAKPIKDKTYLTIPHADCKKFFAICNQMCYNIIISGQKPPKGLRKNRITVKKTGEGGLLAPAYFAVKRPGLIVGAILFVIFCVALNGRLLGYSLGGVPAKDRSGVMRTLSDCGVERFKSFSKIDEELIAKRIVAEIAAIGFATVYKEGSFLVVKTLPIYVEGDAAKKEDILSPVDGVIEKIAVLRGTALVEKGATVKKGQPLVGAYFLAGEQSFPTVPAAEIIIRAEFAFSLEVRAADERAIAAVIAVAKEKCPETNIIEQNYTVSEVDSGFLVTVTLTYFKRIGG